MTAGWTTADAAELDALLHRLVGDYWRHRESCRACRRDPCPHLVAWREHERGCRACQGAAPLSHPTSDACRARRRAFVEHGDSCPRCNPCPHLRQAISAVLDWREARMLLSRAEDLRAERDAFGREAA